MKINGFVIRNKFLVCLILLFLFIFIELGHILLVVSISAFFIFSSWIMVGKKAKKNKEK